VGIFPDEADSDPGKFLLVKTVASLLFIIIVGPPLTLFNPINYVETWLLQGHHSPLDTKSKIRKITEQVGNMSKVWKLRFKVYLSTR
jgi:hypothetical protein